MSSELVKKGKVILNYDYIIIDCPPLGSVIDAAVVAKECDGAIIVIETDNASYKIVQRVKKQLDQSGCRILGAVLNKVEMGGKGYYGKGYYGNYYGRYYGDYGSYGSTLHFSLPPCWSWNVCGNRASIYMQTESRGHGKHDG